VTAVVILTAGDVDNGAGEAGEAGDVFSHTRSQCVTDVEVEDSKQTCLGRLQHEKTAFQLDKFRHTNALQ